MPVTELVPVTCTRLAQMPTDGTPVSENVTCVTTCTSPLRCTMFVVPGSVMSPSMGTNRLVTTVGGPGLTARADTPKRQITAHAITIGCIIVLMDGISGFIFSLSCFVLLVLIGESHLRYSFAQFNLGAHLFQPGRKRFDLLLLFRD